MAEEFLLTQAAVDELKAELKVLRTTRRTEVAEKIKEAKSFGDLSENSEYDEAKAEQGKVESRINELEEILKTVIVIDESEIQTDVVDIGAIVAVFNKTAGREIEYTIVGATEANPLKGKISDRSPIGKAIVGKKAGDVVEVETPAGVITVEILNIRK